MPNSTIKLVTITILSSVLPKLISCAPVTSCCNPCCAPSCNNDLQAPNQVQGSAAERPTIYPPSAIEYCDDGQEDKNWDRSVEAAGARSPIAAVLDKDKLLKDEGLPPAGANAELYSFLLLRDGMKLLTGVFND